MLRRWWEELDRMSRKHRDAVEQRLKRADLKVWAVRGGVLRCWRCHRPILPGDAVVRGHTADPETDGRRLYPTPAGTPARPEHRACNQSAGVTGRRAAEPHPGIV